MADTPSRLVGPSYLGTVAATLYTVPAGDSVVLRDVEVCNESGASAKFTLSIGLDAGGTRLFKDAVIPGDGVPRQWTGNIPMAAGEVIQGYSDTGSALTVIIGGVLTTP